MSEITILPEGVHEQVAPEIYHRQPSYSRGDLVPRRGTKEWTPAAMRWAKDHPEENKRTPDKDFGSALHTLMLEPDQFEARHVVNTKFKDFKTNDAKNWRDSIYEKGGTILWPEERDALTQMVQNAREHPLFSRIFRSPNTRRELTMVARDPATGVRIRCRLDILPPGNVIPDIKTCRDASAEGFGKQVWDEQYGFQAAHYLKVHNLLHEKKRDEFLYFCLEKEPPYLCNAYAVPNELIEYCGAILRQRLYTIANCEKTGRWPGYEWNPNAPEFTLPGYARYKIEEITNR